MTRSDSITQLVTALAKAQAEMAGAKKDSENPHFRSKYADLAAVRDAFVVDGTRCWNEPHLVARATKPECKVCVFAVSRLVFGVETAKLIPHGFAKRNGSTGNEISLAREAVLRPVRVFIAPIVMGGAIAPENAACFLERSIVVEELGTHHASPGKQPESLDELVEPAFDNPRVAVQQDDNLAFSARRS